MTTARPTNGRASSIRRALTTATLAAAAPTLAGGVFLTASGTAVAPEPARLDGNLSDVGSTAPAFYVESHTPTSAYYVPKTWTNSYAYRSIPTGTPCADYNATVNTILTKIVIHAGNYTRCADPL